MRKKLAIIGSLGFVAVGSIASVLVYYVDKKSTNNNADVKKEFDNKKVTNNNPITLSFEKNKISKPNFSINNELLKRPLTSTSRDGKLGFTLDGFDNEKMEISSSKGILELDRKLIWYLSCDDNVKVTISLKDGYCWNDGTSDSITATYKLPHSLNPSPIEPVIDPKTIKGNPKQIIQSAYWDGNSFHGKNGYRYQIGSQTKMFTAASTLKLIDNQTIINGSPITLETKLSQIFDKEYIDKFKGIHSLVPNVDFRVGDITIKQLITHTSGIPDYLNLKDADGSIKGGDEILLTIKRDIGSRAFGIDDVITLIKKYNNFGGNIIGQQSYSNTGYFLLGEVIRKVSGMSYYQYVAKNLFAPLGMNSTNFDYSDIQGWFGFMEATFPDKSFFYSAGGAVSTLPDMISWGLAIQHKDTKIMSKEMWRKWIDISKNLYKFGAGLFTGQTEPYAPFAKESLLGHIGKTFGYHSITVVDTKNVYVYSSNHSGEDIVSDAVYLFNQHPQS